MSIWVWGYQKLPKVFSVRGLGDALDDGGGDGSFEVLHGPGQQVNPRFLANFVPQLMLLKGSLEEGFEGKGQGGGFGLDLGAILRQRDGGNLGGEGFEEGGGMGQGLMQGFSVLGGEGVGAHHFHEGDGFTLRGLGWGICHGGLLAV